MSSLTTLVSTSIGNHQESVRAVDPRRKAELVVLFGRDLACFFERVAHGSPSLPSPLQKEPAVFGANDRGDETLSVVNGLGGFDGPTKNLRKALFLRCQPSRTYDLSNLSMN
jgi:hypothetical protein